MKRKNVANVTVPLPDRLQVFPDGRVVAQGIDYDTRDMYVLARNKDTIVVQVPGRTSWAGQAMPRTYYSPLTIVFLIIATEKTKRCESMKVRPLIEWETKRKKG